MENKNNKYDPMDKNRKTALVVLSIFSVAIIAMWFINFKQNLKTPFIVKGDILASDDNKSSCADGNCENNLSSDNLDLKLKDTDSDGISDWDELFVYNTSPYLEDTDGDGLSDYEEIFVYMTDPSCPEGQECQSSIYKDDTQAVNSSLDDLSYFENLLEGLGETDDKELPEILKPEAVSPEYLRKELLGAGISQEDLDLINDEQLLEIYQEALSEF